ncbi:gamma-glutamyltransferase family protein [Halocatena marina]|uniref:Gamma-glutamyltransferase family protein n=1 Tax=Halocatena marina TaxID=2934937 RepID=A0ABD5YP60_9EURY|nr:gamma-glutamyltransferase family protein [Halocatena marina]
MDSDIDQFGSRRSTVYAHNGVVTTSQPLAASAGLRVLREGGNAFDAAVATAAMLNVVEPTSTGLGGDVFMLYRTADGSVGGMRSCGGAPAGATRERVREALGNERGVAPEEATMPERGPHTVTVPGTARGWELTVERFGRRSFAEVLQPAIQSAIDGYPVSEVIASAWTHAETLFERANARSAYLVGGKRAPRAGETVTLPELGSSLQTIAERGADAVYEGPIADAIVTEVQDAGGFLTMDDLAAFEPELLTPVSASYNGVEVYELPPNNQGLIALEALTIAEELGAGDCEYTSAERVHRFAEATKLAFHDGHRYITDPAYEEIPPLASTAYGRKRAQQVGEKAGEFTFGVPDAHAEDADTVLLCVADNAGNVVSYINSRFAGFGSGLVAGDTGIALQNRGSSFSLNPEHPNRLEPEKRPFHTLIPGLLEFGPDDWAAFGVMGGYMQPQGHVQVVSNLVDYDHSLQAALDAPRWRYRENGRLAVETRIPERIQHGLVRRGHDLSILSPIMFGGAQIARNNHGTLSAATEPRKDGNAVGY